MNWILFSEMALAKGPATPNSVVVQTSALESILQASPVVQLTLLILVGLSVVCWAIAFAKYRQFRNMQESNELFLSRFWKATSLDALFENIDQYEDSSLARVFKSAYKELNKLSGSLTSIKLGALDNLERSLRKATDRELSFMESKLTVLATTGSTGPFIGLFGTVWGIMSSFHKIGQTGSASLAVVAPGISEALVATAIGLAAAIPAVVLYNNFIAKVRKEEMELNNFCSDFLNLMKRNLMKAE